MASGSIFTVGQNKMDTLCVKLVIISRVASSSAGPSLDIQRNLLRKLFKWKWVKSFYSTPTPPHPTFLIWLNIVEKCLREKGDYCLMPQVSISMIKYEQYFHGCCNVENCRLEKFLIFWTLKPHCVQLTSMPHRHSSQMCLQVQTCLRLHASGAECKGQSLHWSSSALSGEWQYDSLLNIHTVNTTSEVDNFM